MGMYVLSHDDSLGCLVDADSSVQFSVDDTSMLVASACVMHRAAFFDRNVLKVCTKVSRFVARLKCHRRVYVRSHGEESEPKKVCGTT